MTAEYFSVGGKLTAVVGQLTVLENFLCCRSTAGLRKFHKFCRSSEVDPTDVNTTTILKLIYVIEQKKHPACIEQQINLKVLILTANKNLRKKLK